MKSERVGQAWAEKKRRAAELGEKMTAMGPAWLRLVEGRWVVIEQAAQTIRRIFRMVTDGFGLSVIVKRLNAESAPVIGTAEHWCRSYLSKLTVNRAVVGEHQPHVGNGKGRRPDGPPIANYYPPILSEEEWYAARAALASRRSKPGRPSKAILNVFSGLLYDARDGGPIHLMSERSDHGPRKVLVSSQAVKGVKGSKYVSFPFLAFDEAVLKELKELDPRDVLPKGAGDAEDKAQVLAGRLTELDAEVEKLKARLETRYSDAVADVLERHETRRAKLAEELSHVRQQASTPLGETWGNYKSLYDVLKEAPDAEDTRTKIRAALRRMVSQIMCLFVAKESLRLAAVQIHFTNDGHRDYFIAREQARGNASATRPAQLSVKSVGDVLGQPPLDLRKRTDARALDKALTDLDLAEVMGIRRGRDTEGRNRRRREKARARRASKADG
jgi:hypothetical protein